MRIGLEIHHINIQGGDCTAIVVISKTPKPDGSGCKRIIKKKVLIDSGYIEHGNLGLAAYCDRYFENREFDIVIASHYHEDHVKGFKNANISTKHIIDIGGYLNRPAFPNKGRLKLSDAYSGWVNYLKNTYGQTNIITERPEFLDQSYLQNPINRRPYTIKLSESPDPEILLHCVYASGILDDGTNLIDLQKKTGHHPSIDHNDLSMVWLLEFETENFRYLTAGDLSGNVSNQGKYYDLERPVLRHLMKHFNLNKKPVSALKANHHGSEHSNYMDSTSSLFSIAQPETIIVPCNFPRHEIPKHTFFERLKPYVEKAPHKVNLFFVNLIAFHKRMEQFEAFQELNKTNNIVSNLFSKPEGIASDFKFFNNLFKENTGTPSEIEPSSIVIVSPVDADVNNTLYAEANSRVHDTRTHRVIVRHKNLPVPTLLSNFYYPPPQLRLTEFILEHRGYVDLAVKIQIALFLVAAEKDKSENKKVLTEIIERKYPIFQSDIDSYLKIEENKKKDIQGETITNMYNKAVRLLYEIFDETDDGELYEAKVDYQELFCENQIITINNLLINSTQNHVKGIDPAHTNGEGHIFPKVGLTEIKEQFNNYKSGFYTKYPTSAISPSRIEKPLKRESKRLKRKRDET